VGALELLRAQLSALPGVECTRSRFGQGGRPAWRIGAREFAHLHSDTLLDLRLPRPVQARLRGDSRAHFRAGRSEWVEVEFHNEQDVPDLIALAQQALAAARGDG
jgi:Family of unknown function (DUF5519)